MKPIFIISGEMLGETEEQNRKNTIRLRLKLDAKGVGYKQAVGMYDGTKEVSFIVSMPENEGHEFMQNLIIDFAQESYLYSDSRRFTTLHFRGNKFVQLGHLSMLTKAQAEARKEYTIADGHYYGIL